MKRILLFLYRKYLSIRWKREITPILVNAFYNDYKKHKVPYWRIHQIHKKGFKVEDWYISAVTEQNYKNYLSNVQYYCMHPINGLYSKWIDDKLTLKYVCSGTILDKYMPKYYFMIDNNSRIYALMDYNASSNQIDAMSVARFLTEKKILAIKLVDGAIGRGFIKAEYKDEWYWLNGEKVTVEEFCKRIASLKNYLITEYFYPHKDLAKFCDDRINCTRILLGRINGKMEIIKSYIRFGTKNSGYVENYAVGGVLCYLDREGNFKQGNIMDKKELKNRVIHKHPDNDVLLKARLPMWDEMLRANEEFDRFFPQMKYLGIDYVVTSDNEIKVLEINSLTSLDALQFYGSILDEPEGVFFKDLLK